MRRLLVLPIATMLVLGSSTNAFAKVEIPNGSFRSGTSGWRTSDAPVTAASDNDGHSTGRVALSTTASSSAVVGWWHLDETGGTTAFDSSGNGNNGAISGPVTLGAPGHLNTAYSFVPQSTVIVPNASDLVPGTATITVSYWLNTATLPCCNAVDYDMFTKGDHSSSGGQIKIEVQENGQASCMFRGSSGGKQLQAGPNVVDGRWHQVTCVRNGTQIVETVDGASFSLTKATGAITVTDPVRLGSHKNGGDWYRGALDEVTYSIGSVSTNQPPTVNAGSDRTVTLPNSATLSGSASDDGLPNPPGTLTTTWSQVSGPGTVSFGNASSLSTTASFSASGTYVLRLTADDSALQSSDDLTVTVNPAGQNLVGNPGFETDTIGWSTSGSDPGVTLTRVSGGHSGGWSGLVSNGGSGTAGTCKMQDSPNWVTTTSAGTYTASLWVRADSPGATLTIKLREYNNSSQVGLQKASITLTTSWQLVSVSYVPAMPGASTLDFLGLVSNAPVGTCFYADDISIAST